MKRILWAAATACVMAGPAMAGGTLGWEERISAFDRERIEQLDAALAQGRAEAERGGAPGDLAAVRGALDAAPVALGDLRDLRGTWRCRIMKLGGLTPVVVYTWFTCRIRATEGGLVFEKTTGSQRLRGMLYPRDETSAVVLASFHVAGERAGTYSGSGPALGAETTHTDQAGILRRLGPNHARVEFPKPLYESTFDVLELKR